MAVQRVSTHRPPGGRSCGGTGGNSWAYARDAAGAMPFLADVERLRGSFPSAESSALYLAQVKEHMGWAAAGRAPSDIVKQMRSSPDVLELVLPDWIFTGGRMHVRLYYSEPHALPATLVALRLLTKRPGPIGVAEQDRQIAEASELLLAFQDRGFAS